jgi:outer membrane immunogenic protein
MVQVLAGKFGILRLNFNLGVVTMTRLLLTTAALVGIAMTGAAKAADLPMPEPVYKAPPPMVYNWTGCYVGGGGGFGLWNQDTNAQTGGVVVTQTTTSGGRGWFGQGQAGCDYQFGLPLGSFWSPNVVIGAFGDYEWTGNSMRGTVSSPLGGFGAESMPWSWAAGARAGVLVTPKFLTYFDGGYTQANFSQVNGLTSGGSPIPAFMPANTYNGWFIGSGFEYSFDFLPGLFFKTEFRYSTYNTANLPVLPTAFSINSTKYVEMVSTELVWRFNWFGH